MSLRPYKFQIVAVCQQVEDDGVVGEQVVGGPDGQPVTVFGVDGLHAFADSFEQKLKEADSPNP